MFEKLKFIAWSIILIGIFMLIVNFGTLGFYSFGIILFGLSLHLIGSLINKKNLPVLCRIGYHKYEVIGYDNEIKSMRVYKCLRCGKKHKAILGGGGG